MYYSEHTFPAPERNVAWDEACVELADEILHEQEGREIAMERLSPILPSRCCAFGVSIPRLLLWGEQVVLVKRFV